MKILMCHYMISDFGGIINSTEGLIRGLQALGHEVDPILLEWKPYGASRSAGSGTSDSHSVTGMVIDQRGGYRFPTERRFGYKGATKKWKQFVKNYDLVFWQIPVPTQTAANKGNHEWPELYDIDVPQIAHSHDGNIFNTPWISVVSEKWRGMGCVHSCALKGAKKVVPVPLSWAPSPQWDIERRMAGRRDARARQGWLSLQTFKRWKRVDDLVRAVPFMKDPGPRLVAGGGIERYYMTSQEKVKPVYVWNPRDKDYRDEFSGQTIWQAALDNDMQYLDYIGNEKRDRLLYSRKALIDPSWSDTYARYGAHFNRVVIDGLICGAVPIMRDWKDPDSPLVPNVHFIPMPPTEAGPAKIAKVIDDVCRDLWSSWQVKADEIIPLFEAKNVARIFLELAEGRGDTRGKSSTTFNNGGQEALRGYFSRV